ncbi:hypothetical protein MWU59_04025 [Flavobacteriaceae bacterium F08102]|nr:hypothetical protein [Flavobacteriaceae bacterium F08102]
MKKKIPILFFLVHLAAFCQTPTEVYVFDFTFNDSIQKVENPINISNNKGYDNQPSFLNDGTGVLYTSTRNGQTDVVLYNLENHTKAWLTDTPGSEYSPIQTPKKKYFTAIRLDNDETQRLWQYSFNRRKSEILLPNLTVGYHTWFDKNLVASFILGDPSVLMVSNLKYDINYPIDKNIGRSIHRIPYTDLLSFISLEHGEPEIYQINPITSEKKYIADPLPDSQDMAWTQSGILIMGKGDSLYKLVLNDKREWVKFASLAEFNLTGITRLAISPHGDKIAIVVEETN